MIRTALIYSLIDHCLDIMFNRIDGVLRLSDAINPGDRFEYLCSNVHMCFYDVVIADVSKTHIYFSHRSMTHSWYSVPNVENMRLYLENDCKSNKSVSTYSIDVLWDTIRLHVNYKEPIGIAIRSSTINLLRSKKK